MLPVYQESYLLHSEQSHFLMMTNVTFFIPAWIPMQIRVMIQNNTPLAYHYQRIRCANTQQPLYGRNGGFMALLYHKLLLFLLSLSSLFMGEIQYSTIAAMLLSVSISALCSYSKEKYAWKLCLLQCAAAFLWPPLLPFLPLTAYDCCKNKQIWHRWFWIIPLLTGIITLEPLLLWTSTMLCILAVFLCTQSRQYQQLLHEYHQVRDDATETALLLQEKNRELIKNQDYEVEVATLAERNRIAREIHDNVGHLLTRSILQVSALQVVYGNDQELTEQIGAVKTTLTDAMDNVRQSVHNLHEESIDLKQQVTHLVGDFTFCPVDLIFDSGQMPKEVNYAVIAIVKEALSNIARHSNATKASISILEHPSLYQIQIRDNGTSIPYSGWDTEDQNGISRDGMGLSNMEERIRAFHGIFHIDKSNGFKIFISIPKYLDETNIQISGHNKKA